MCVVWLLFSYSEALGGWRRCLDILNVHSCFCWDGWQEYLPELHSYSAAYSLKTPNKNSEVLQGSSNGTHFEDQTSCKPMVISTNYPLIDLNSAWCLGWCHMMPPVLLKLKWCLEKFTWPRLMFTIQHSMIPSVMVAKQLWYIKSHQN